MLPVCWCWSPTVIGVMGGYLVVDPECLGFNAEHLPQNTADFLETIRRDCRA